MSQRFSVVTGCGGWVPKQRVTNKDLEIKVDTTDEWIRTRTGIEARHIASSEETTAFLGTQAALVALKQAKKDPSDIDFLICATCTPDLTFPATATLIQRAIGMKQGFAFDIQAVCSGFVYGLTVADAMMKVGHGKCALVIGADVCSKIVDWTDRNTCVLFGDGAGAVVLEQRENQSLDAPRGILDSLLYSDGTFVDLLRTSGGVGTTQEGGVILMQGREVYRHAVEKMTQSVQDLLTKNGLSIQDVNWLVPHQANKRIMMAVASRLGLPESRVIVTVDRHANTTAATIPLALSFGVDEGLIKPGDLLVLEALGGGFTWGSVLLRW